MPRRPVRRNGTVSQRTVSDWSGVSAGTLKNLARIGLLPEADSLRPHDVVLAQVAAALGATRSTNRDSQPDARTTEAQKRDWEAVRVVAELVLNDVSEPVHPRTRLLALPSRVALFTQDYDLLRLSEEALTACSPFQVLPVGLWYQELQQKLDTPVEEDTIAA
ncbi:hypothetical protein ACFRIB_41095 [Streptomyces mirabilis]|uniref:hypothetical protein n=1 Tax=Streptomyces mirabilis TaxID=68239 RepID=UPI0036B4488E